MTEWVGVGFISEINGKKFMGTDKGLKILEQDYSTRDPTLQEMKEFNEQYGVGKFKWGTTRYLKISKVIIVRTDEGYQSHTGLEWRQSTEKEIKECGF